MAALPGQAQMLEKSLELDPAAVRRFSTAQS